MILLIMVLNSFMLMGQIRQQGIALHLQVDERNKLTIYQDEPLMISISISNPGAAYNEQWNRLADQYLKQLNKELQDSELTAEQYELELTRIQQSKKNIQVPVIGIGTQPAYQKIKFEWKNEPGTMLNYTPFMMFLDHASMTKEIVLDANAYYVLQWGINRKEVSKLKPGRYILTATLENYNSEPVELVILTSAIPVSKLNTIAMQQKLGKFELLFGASDSAVIYAKNILEQDPTSIDGLILLGEANIKKNNYREALKNFEEALVIFNKKNSSSPEPPEYIFGMIEWLKKKVK